MAGAKTPRACPPVLVVAILAAGLTLGDASSAAAAKHRRHLWYVSATARPGGNGSRHSPFRTLAKVQQASHAGDKIVILPAPMSVAPLNGGIRLKAGQALVGAGPAVAGRTKRLRRLPALANTSGKNLAGDAIRLASNTTVRNVVVRRAYRGAIHGLDSGVLRVTQDRNTETYIGSPGADCEGQFANTAGSGQIYDTVNHNVFAHAIGGTSCNGFETIVSTGNGKIVANLSNSTFRDNVGDMFEEGNLGAGSTMRFVADNVYADRTSVRGGNPPGSSDQGSNPIPFNIGDCMVAGHNGGADSTTFVLRNSVFKHCNNGISLGSNVGQGNGTGPAKELIADISHSVITQNAKYGLQVGNLTPSDLLQVN